MEAEKVFMGGTGTPFWLDQVGKQSTQPFLGRPVQQVCTLRFQVCYTFNSWSRYSTSCNTCLDNWAGQYNKCVQYDFNFAIHSTDGRGIARLAIPAWITVYCNLLPG